MNKQTLSIKLACAYRESKQCVFVISDGLSMHDFRVIFNKLRRSLYLCKHIFYHFIYARRREGQVYSSIMQLFLEFIVVKNN